MFSVCGSVSVRLARLSSAGEIRELPVLALAPCYPSNSPKEDYTLDEQHCDAASHRDTCGELDNPDGSKTLNPAPGR